MDSIYSSLSQVHKIAVISFVSLDLSMVYH